MILDSTSRSLEVLLGSAVTTQQLSVVSSWTDLASSSTTSGSTPVVTTGTTAVTAVPAPSSGVQRNVYAVTIFNADTAAATVKVRLNDGGTMYQLVSVVLQPGHTLAYTDVNSWQVLSANGAVVTTSSTTFLPATVVSGVVTASGASYSLGLGDAGCMIDLSHTSAATVPIPSNASTAFPVGTFVLIKQGGAGVITVTAGSGVTLRAANGVDTSAQHDVRAAVKIDTNVWVVL